MHAREHSLPSLLRPVWHRHISDGSQASAQSTLFEKSHSQGTAPQRAPALSPSIAGIFHYTRTVHRGPCRSEEARWGRLLLLSHPALSSCPAARQLYRWASGAKLAEASNPPRRTCFDALVPTGCEQSLSTLSDRRRLSFITLAALSSHPSKRTTWVRNLSWLVHRDSAILFTARSI
jgi:hypothetical protein